MRAQCCVPKQPGNWDEQRMDGHADTRQQRQTALMLCMAERRGSHSAELSMEYMDNNTWEHWVPTPFPGVRGAGGDAPALLLWLGAWGEEDITCCSTRVGSSVGISTMGVSSAVWRMKFILLSHP